MITLYTTVMAQCKPKGGSKTVLLQMLCITPSSHPNWLVFHQHGRVYMFSLRMSHPYKALQLLLLLAC